VEEEQEQEIVIRKFASPSERRAQMAERREQLLRKTREEAERAGSSSIGKAAAPVAPEASSTGSESMSEMLKRLSTSVSCSAAGCAEWKINFGIDA
jgi:hypothetical protein